MNLKYLIILFLFLLSYSPFLKGQNLESKSIEFSQVDFDNHKIHNDTYTFWSHMYDNRWIPKKDTLPYFVDERQYKGIINYGLEFALTNNKNLYYKENYELYKLNITIRKCIYNPIDSIIKIDGTIKGGWTKNDFRDVKLNFKNNVHIYIGKKKYTSKPLIYTDYHNPDEYIVKYKGKKIINPIVLDTLPSLHLYDYKHFTTNFGKERTFTVQSKIDKNSILILGLYSSFSEIYDLAGLVFLNNKTAKKPIDKNTSYPFHIIRNNVQVSKIKNTIKPELLEYHKITSLAENYILRKQFGRAKIEYKKLLNRETRVFARDLHNAIRCASIARDYKMAILCAEKLVLKGASLKYFDANIFDRLKKDSSWNVFVKKHPSLHEHYKSELNYNLIQELDTLVALDKSVYKRNTKGLTKQSELIQITTLTTKRLIDVIKKEGFPTEERIGVQFSSNGMGILNPSYYVLLYHNYQSRNKNFNELLKIRSKAAKKLEYDAHRDGLDIFKKAGYTCLQIYKGNLYKDKSCLLNENEVKKIKFRFHNEHNFIINSGTFIIIPFEKENEKKDQNFIENRFDFVTKLTEDWFFYEK